MAIDSYDKLQAHIADRINRDDLSAAVTAFSPAALDSEIQRAIELAEERVSHDILSRGGIKYMETVKDDTDTGGGVETVSLPTDFSGLRSLAITTNPLVILTAYPDPNALFKAFPGQDTGQPRAYSIVGNRTAYLRPIPDAAYDLRIIYYATLPALSASNTSNWLLENAVGVYEGAALVEICMQLESDRLQFWEGFYKQKLNDLMGDDRMTRYAGTPAKPSIDVTIA